MRTFWGTLLALVTMLPVWSQGDVSLQPVRLGKKFGFINSQGTLVLPAQFDWAWPFTEGRSGVRVAKDWFLLNEQGKRVNEERYDWVGPFGEGLAPARLGRKWGFIGLDGTWKIEPYFSDARPFRERVAAVQIGGDYAIVDKTSCFEGVAGVDLAPPLGDRVAPGALGGKWALINAQGVFLSDPIHDEIREAREGRIPFRKGVAWGFLDTHGKIQVQARYLTVDHFRSGWARVTLLTGKTGFINHRGDFVEHRMLGDLGLTEP